MFISGNVQMPSCDLRLLMIYTVDKDKKIKRQVKSEKACSESNESLWFYLYIVSSVA